MQPNAPTRPLPEFEPNAFGLPRLASAGVHHRFGTPVELEPLHPRDVVKTASICARVNYREALALRRSWAYAWPTNVVEEAGLSNGSYHAVHVPHGINAKPSANLRAKISLKPGTVKFRISGTFSRFERNHQRGQIKYLSRHSKTRMLEATRELEARNYVPEIMMSNLLPRDWRATLTDNTNELERVRTLWADLEQWRKRVASARQNLKRNPHQRWAFDVLLESYNAKRAEVGRAIAELRAKGPDGRKVKQLFDAFLKRFDRSYGSVLLQTLTITSECERERVEAEAAHLVASYQEQYPVVKVVRKRPTKTRPESIEIRGLTYRMMWWLEFQRRGAPHIHILLFDTRGLDFNAVRQWVGPAWAAVCAGKRSLVEYLNPQLQGLYHEWREFAGKEVAEQVLEAKGLDISVWHHIRAGTRVERMRKSHWGYAAAEASGGRYKGYQKLVPKDFRNVGRWWGFRRYERAPENTITYELTNDQQTIEQLIAPALEAAAQALPIKRTTNKDTGKTEWQGAYKFSQKMHRFAEAIRRNEEHGYITFWGDGPRQAVERVLTA